MLIYGVLLLASGALGCDKPGGNRRSPAVVDTLESGVIVVRNSGTGAWTDEEAWSAVERVRIGSVGGDSVTVFGDVWDVTLDRASRIYVLDRQSKDVRVFAPTGEYVRTLGREGRGPGEFSNPIGLAWDRNDRLWIADTRNARYTVFDTAGNYVESHRREIGGWGYPWGGAFDAEGQLYEPSYFSDPTDSRTRNVYIRHTVAGEIAATDTFELPAADLEGSFYRIDLPNGYSIVGIPFTPELTWRFDGRGGFWFALSDQYRLYHRALVGDTLRIVEAEYERVPVQETDIAEVRERYGRYGSQHVNQIISRMPQFKPAFQTFAVDDEGYLWVARSNPAERAGGLTFDVFDAEGIYLGALDVQLGIAPPPRIMGASIVGVDRDELDVPHVVVYRIDGRQTSR
jgi:hypothetical protein